LFVLIENIYLLCVEIIENKFMKYDVCVIGACGHIGLPLAIMLTAKGKEVCIYDINEKNIE
jgi:UDP-N-acetyl-D-mannosaminuronic acid dehydrogenase